MQVACLWSDWGDGDELLQSFAIITNEPPAEVKAAGHDRMIVRIRPEDLGAWLSPDPDNLQALYELLDRRPRPYYRHRIAVQESVPGPGLAPPKKRPHDPEGHARPLVRPHRRRACARENDVEGQE